jgi:hypothetical protein
MDYVASESELVTGKSRAAGVGRLFPVTGLLEPCYRDVTSSRGH